MLIHVRVEHGGGRRGRRVERARTGCDFLGKSHAGVCVCARDLAGSICGANERVKFNFMCCCAPITRKENVRTGFARQPLLDSQQQVL